MLDAVGCLCSPDMKRILLSLVYGDVFGNAMHLRIFLKAFGANQEGHMRVILDYLSDRESLVRHRQELRNPEEVMRMFHALTGDTRYLEHIAGMKEEGGSTVCDLLDEMVNRGREIVIQEGLKALISACREFGLSFDATAVKVKENSCLGDGETGNSMELYCIGKFAIMINHARLCKDRDLTRTLYQRSYCSLAMSVVQNFENRINSLNIGIKCHSEINLETYGVDNTICQAVFLFYCMANKQV